MKLWLPSIHSLKLAKGTENGGRVLLVIGYSRPFKSQRLSITLTLSLKERIPSEKNVS